MAGPNFVLAPGPAGLVVNGNAMRVSRNSSRKRYQVRRRSGPPRPPVASARLVDRFYAKVRSDPEFEFVIDNPDGKRNKLGVDLARRRGLLSGPDLRTEGA